MRKVLLLATLPFLVIIPLSFFVKEPLIVELNVLYLFAFVCSFVFIAFECVRLVRKLLQIADDLSRIEIRNETITKLIESLN